MVRQRNDDICQLCKKGDINDGSHKLTAEHSFNFVLFEWNQYKKALVKDRHGIQVSIRQIQHENSSFIQLPYLPNKGCYAIHVSPMQFGLCNKIIEFSCTVTNDRKSDNVLFTSALVLHSAEKKFFSMYDPSNQFINDAVLELAPKASYTVRVKFQLPNIVVSSFKVPVIFKFQTTGDKVETFDIARSIHIQILDQLSLPEDKTKSPFTFKEWPRNVAVIPCKHKAQYRDQFTIPASYKSIFEFGLNQFNSMTSQNMQDYQRLIKQMNDGHLTFENYRDYYHNVLWLEEVGEAIMLQRYNMENVTLDGSGKCFELTVPGLAEKRPSIIRNDFIEIRVHDEVIAYQGVVKEVLDKSIRIGDLPDEFEKIVINNRDTKLDVRFVLNRLQHERMHQGVNQIVRLKEALFPTKQNFNSNFVIQLHDKDFDNQLVANNFEQRTAVEKIVNKTSGSAPYIVYGPPGTGKTVTIVEAIYQLKLRTKSRILVCAPANAACDMLAKKLLVYCQKSELIRVHSESIDRSGITEDLRKFSNIDGSGAITKPTPEELMSYRIVITTLILIGRYSRHYHPDIVFIDEAAQAPEPEVGVAIGHLSVGKQIVLAGDPKQLGPTCSSKVAAKYGLEKSFLERLMNFEQYATWDSNYITMLKENYRSHELILQLPNKLFYENELKACSVSAREDPISKIIFCRLFAGSNKRNKREGKALEFYGSHAKEKREGRSPSYYNIEESQLVVKYVRALLTCGLSGEFAVLQSQIGVVTPYIRQVYKIKGMLKDNGFEEVEVGTTETFQGREKRVMLISSVRAQNDLLLHDRKYNLGFVSNEKRFNVAITRAMSKLIIIGNPMVLGTDAKWLQLIELCEQEKCYFGAPYIRRNQQFRDDITRQMRGLNLIDSQNRQNS